MRLYRDLAPAPVSSQDAHVHITKHNAIPSISSQSSRPSRRRHTAAEWDTIKDFVLHTYSTQTLDDTMRIVKQERGFEAGTRQYKNKLTEWGVEKHFKEDDMKFVSEKRRARRQQGVNTAFSIRGTRIHAERITRFDDRLRSSGVRVDAYSPKATPDGIIYYTPADGVLSPETLAQAAHVYSPTSRWSNSAVNSHNLMRTDDIAAMLLGYGNTTRTVVTLQVERNNAASKAKRARRREGPAQTMSDQEREWSSKKWRQKESSKQNPGPEADVSLKRHTHRQGGFLVAGSGFLRNLDPLQSLLCDGNNFCLETMNVVKSGSAQRFQSDGSGFHSLVADKAPAYAIISKSETDRTKAMSSVLRVMQQSSMIGRLMGPSGISKSNWPEPWRCMAGDEAHRLVETAAALFGPDQFQGSNLEVTIILVRFITHTANQMPSLLRVVLAESLSTEHKACRACHDFATAVDYIGPDSAAKFQTARSCLNPGAWIDSFSILASSYLVKQETFCVKWTRLTNLEQGLLAAKHMRRCHCGGAVHEGGYRPHYIDMEEETAATHERWDPAPEDRTGGAAYDPYPAERFGDLVVIENFSSSDTESDEDHWDPHGQELSTAEAYDAFPSEDEENHKYVSKPKFLSHFCG